MREVPLSRGKVALVDDADYDEVMQWKWSACFPGKWYAVRKYRAEDGLKKMMYLHRFLLRLEPGDGRVVDHLNGDSLDNRRANLEVVTQSENASRGWGWTKRGRKKKSEPFL